MIKPPLDRFEFPCKHLATVKLGTFWPVYEELERVNLIRSLWLRRKLDMPFESQP